MENVLGRPERHAQINLRERMGNVEEDVQIGRNENRLPPFLVNPFGTLKPFVFVPPNSISQLDSNVLPRMLLVVPQHDGVLWGPSSSVRLASLEHHLLLPQRSRLRRMEVGRLNPRQGRDSSRVRR